MARPRLAVGSRSLAAAGVLLISTQNYYPLVLLLLGRGQTAAWALSLLSAGLTAGLVWPVAAALRRIPGGTVINLARLAFGPAGAVVTGTLLAAAFCFSGGLIVRETSEMAISAVFPHTPQTFATTTLLLGAVFIAHGDGAALVRLGRLVLPLVLFSVAVVVVGILGWIEWRTLLPLWGPGPGALLLRTPEAAKIFTPVTLLYLLAGHVTDRAPLVRWMVAVPLFSGLILALHKALLVMVFPYPLGLDVTFPLHAEARLLLGGRFFERLEGLWVFTWVTATIVLTGALLHGAATAFSQAFAMPRHTTAVLSLATVILTTAFFPPNQADTVKLHQRAAVLVVLVNLILPAVLALVALLRRRGRGHGR